MDSAYELKEIGILNEGVTELAKGTLAMMRKHPDLLKPNLFALKCANGFYKPPGLLTTPTLSELSAMTSFSPSVGTNTTVVSGHAPDDYERTHYYNGIAGDGDCPELIYRSNYLTTPFPKPTGSYCKTPVKPVYGVFGTRLNEVWGTIGDQVRAIVKAAVPNYSCIDTARFCTHGPEGFTHGPDTAKGEGSLGPVTIWVGVPPGSTTPDTAHSASHKLLALLHKHGIDDVVVEWRDAVLQKLSGPPLLPSTYRDDATYTDY